jgi:hypothetical protein
MKANIAISIGIVIVILLGVIAFRLSDPVVRSASSVQSGATTTIDFTPKQTSPPVSTQTADTYTGSAIQTGGPGSDATTLSAYDSTLGGYLTPAKEYVLISFNSPIDIMWASCKDGYSMTNATSSTGNTIVGNKMYKNVGISLQNQVQNDLAITCEKS